MLQLRDDSDSLELELAKRLSHEELLARVQRLVREDRALTARLLVHLGEIDARALYRDQAYGSMFDYAVNGLHLSESEAFVRIGAARLGRKFPIVLQMLARGELHLSAIKLLAPVLTTTTRESVLELPMFMPQGHSDRSAGTNDSHNATGTSANDSHDSIGISAIAQRKKQHFAATERPRSPTPVRTEDGARDAPTAKHERPSSTARPQETRSRHIPHAVRRQVLARDGEQCSYVSSDGRRCQQRERCSFIIDCHTHAGVPRRQTIFNCSVRCTMPCGPSETTDPSSSGNASRNSKPVPSRPARRANSFRDK
jgi:hypothetical protein